MKKQHKAILRFMVDFHIINGFYPTIREICDGVSISSTSVAQYNLSKLVTLGYVITRPGRARGLSLTNKAFALLGLTHTTSAIPSAEDRSLIDEVRRLQMQIDSLKRLHQAQIAAYEKERETLLDEMNRLHMKVCL